MNHPLVRLLCLCALLPFGCAKEEKPEGPAGAGTPKADPALDRYLLTDDPGEALDVADAKEKEAGETVVVAGRLARVVPGFAAFEIVDDSVDYCGRSGAEDDCETPWDYCCATAERKEGTIYVEARAEDGTPLAAQALPGLRLLDLVAVKGKLVRDEHGNATLVADGWHRKERPTLREGLRWPQ
jgi:hypothetical protein